MRSVIPKEIRFQVYVRAQGRCRRCGSDLSGVWHVDHVQPVSLGGTDDLENLQALCIACNLSKGAKQQIAPRSFWLNFRDVLRGQIERKERPCLTLHVECGAGKTSIPPMASYELRRANLIDAIVWAVPRTNLALSAARAMSPTSPYWTLLGMRASDAKAYEINALTDGNITNPPRGSFGYVLSYDALQSQPLLHVDFFKRKRVLLVSDETQFCAVDRPHGRILERLHELAAATIFMSGDFDRSDRARVACVRYVPDTGSDSSTLSDAEVVGADVDYGIHDALAEKVILPLDFCYGSGRVTFRRGEEVEEVELAQAGEDTQGAVWAAVNSEYGRQLLAEAVASWQAHRRDGVLPHRVVTASPKAQLLVVAGTQRQAREVHRYMLDELRLDSREIGLVVSEERESRAILQDYCDGRLSVIITVAMAYVGTDAPYTTHLCVLTHYRSKPWLHQMFARAWRLCPGMAYEQDYAVAFCPDDPMLIAVVDELKRAQQVGVLAARDAEQREAQRRASMREPNPLIIESSQLTAFRHRREFAATGDMEVRREVSRTLPPVETTRGALRALGYDAAAIAVMLAAAEPARPEATLQERLAELGERLETYQRRTAFIVADHRASGLRPDFHEVNRLLKDAMGGVAREAWSEADFEMALLTHAPAIRARLLGRATPGLTNGH